MKKRIICTISIFVLVAALCSGCSGNPFKITDSFASYYAENKEEAGSDLEGMAADLAVVSDSEATDPNYQSNDYADLLINDSANEIVESYHCFDKLYPASITKVMTALLTLEHGNMDDEITLKHDINLTEDGAVISTLTKGDTVTVGQVFHTMLIKSANDCAVILAEYVAGSEAKFIDMMNERARELGATHTHFVNPNGLHNNDHYTTAYDLYLIFKEAVKHEEFVDTVSSKDYTMTYTTAKKTQINEYMQSTNYYLLNEFPVPEGVVMYGGKTGTTSMAKSCLILMTKNKKGERFFSVVLGAETKEALENTANEKNVTINISGEDIKLHGVRSLLYEIVYNLCENGIKYNKEGGKVDITLSKEAGKDILVVKDTGIGIKEDQQSRIFERFYRVDKSRSKETGGTGLGLSIVKHAAMYHNADVTLESTEGQGSKFTVMFPRE